MNQVSEQPQASDERHGFERVRELLPALMKLGSRKPSIEIMLQTTATDCGAACLAMVLAYLGRHVGLEEIREGMSVGRDGVSARAILEAASRYDLRGRGVRIEIEDLKELEMGAILHWNFSHFVVFEKVDEKGVHIADPALGNRVVTFEETSRSFTGVALLFEKAESFTKSGPKKRTMWKRWRDMLTGSDDLHRVVVTSILLQGLSLLLPLLHGRLVDRVLPRNDMHLMFVVVAAFVTAIVFHFLSSLVRAHIFTHLRTKFDAKLTLGFVEHMLRLPYGFFERRQAADLQMRVSSVATIREVLTGSVLSVLVDGTLVVGHLGFLAFMSLKTAGMALVVVGMQAGVYVGMRKKMMELSAGSIAKQAEAAHSLNELLHGMECLKASGVENVAAQRWASQYVDVLNIGLRRGGVSNLSEAILGTMRIMGPTMLLLVGVAEVASGSTSLGSMLAANAFAVGFIQPVMSLVGTLQQLQTVKAQFDRIEDVLNTTPEQENSNRISSTLKGEIILDRVSFKYGANTPEVVKNVSVSVRPGESIAIVGRSGSGKTTLGRLLLGLYNPTAGSIRYDGKPLAQLDLRALRRQLGVVVQRPHIFGTTVRANIALADPTIPFERVQKAAALAAIDRDIAKMPLGYDTPVVAGGASMSGGQRQRLALARALVNQPAILFLDEATSALDAATEAEVQKNLEGLTCTRIVVAHRLSTVVNANRILVMEDGVLVEQGTHKELLAKGGFYARLVAAQLGEHAVAQAQVQQAQQGQQQRAPQGQPQPQQGKAQQAQQQMQGRPQQAPTPQQLQQMQAQQIQHAMQAQMAAQMQAQMQQAQAQMLAQAQAQMAAQMQAQMRAQQAQQQQAQQQQARPKPPVPQQRPQAQQPGEERTIARKPAPPLPARASQAPLVPMVTPQLVVVRNAPEPEAEVTVARAPNKPSGKPQAREVRPPMLKAVGGGYAEYYAAPADEYFPGSGQSYYPAREREEHEPATQREAELATNGYAYNAWRNQ